MNNYLDAFRKYAKPQGRTTRTEFWQFIIIHFIIIFALAFLLMQSSTNGSEQLAGLFSLAYMFYFFASVVPLFCVMARRLHDTGKSAWFLLLLIVPLGVIALIVLFSVPSTEDNDYGVNRINEKI